jgi:thioredoxin-related protein
MKAPDIEASTEKLKWHRYDKALKIAKKSQKYVLVDFMAVWCGYCTLMQKTTYKDPKVLDLLNKKFVLSRVDIESSDAVKFKGETITEADLSMYFEVTGTPTTWFFDSRGNAITPLPGYVEPDKFHAVLKYIAGGYYKKMKFSEFIKKKL